GGHGCVELLDAFGVVERTHGRGSEPVDEQCRRVAQGALLRRQPDVHQPASTLGASSSRSTRRSTLPDGNRGMASTTTTRCRCLYVASVSATRRCSSSGSTGAAGSSCTAATGTSPARSSGTPNTAQSSTAGCPCSTAS